MKSQEAIQEDEERIRQRVRALPDDKQLQFFKQAEQELKDPDTYAVLNYLFVAGLHHFYLGKPLRGTINLCIFITGTVMLFTGLVGFGLLLIIAITVVELRDLFNSQSVVQDYNNEVMEKIYRTVSQDE
ncbi:TM2 domain-containing protein [Nitrosomonas oligotropha]|uniref:TM2 domain-containing protein n=1 Tax=Nitrosomonas oligotropha TaxID=42354 RepID=UPI00136D9EE1|nr:TM2 domain-containing protein [Nitrosomonas oligotropha]MXS82627.1 TM2 domain-containing protein [Nitrosomonas oligotropha]